jgi:hypothetical protein
MKRIMSITSIALFALVSFVTVGSISAQDRAVKANVPFDFTVGDKLLPAGTYLISAENDNVIKIENRDKHVTMLSTTTSDGKESKTGELVFNKYGDQYFLHDILCSQAAMNMAVPVSKQEKRARALEASLNNTGQQVYLALNR